MGPSEAWRCLGLLLFLQTLVMELEIPKAHSYSCSTGWFLAVLCLISRSETCEL